MHGVLNVCAMCHTCYMYVVYVNTIWISIDFHEEKTNEREPIAM